jgi:hypothetical protein
MTILVPALAAPTANGKVRPRILVLNQYYAPGLEATAQLLAALCVGIADEFEIHVVTGRLRRTRGGDTTRRLEH